MKEKNIEYEWNALKNENEKLGLELNPNNDITYRNFAAKAPSFNYVDEAAPKIYWYLK